MRQVSWDKVYQETINFCGSSITSFLNVQLLFYEIAGMWRLFPMKLIIINSFEKLKDKAAGREQPPRELAK